MLAQEITARGIRLSIGRNGVEVAHAYLYILTNDLHDHPFGFLEDVSVREEYQGKGIGNELVAAIIERAQVEGCYKLLATSRNDGSRQTVHDWYLRLGFRDYGTEFRMNF